MEGVEEGVVVEELWRYVGDVGAVAGGLGLGNRARGQKRGGPHLLDCSLDDRVDGEMRLWDLDVLLKVEQR